MTLWPAQQPRESLSTRTDANGYYEFRDVVPGIYRLRAQRNGFVSQVYGQRGTGPGLTVTVLSDTRTSDVDFRLVAGGVITGAVYDEDGDPVEDLEVAALRIRFAPGGKKALQFIRNSRTNDLGQYRIPSLAPGLYLVQAAGRGQGVSISTQSSAFTYQPAFYPNVASADQAGLVQVTPAAEVRGIDIGIRSGATFVVSGVIVDAVITAARKRYSVGFARRGGTATMESSDGSFTLRGIPPGDYTLVGIVSEDDGPTRRGFATFKLQGDQQVAIVVGRAAELRGKALIEGAEEVTFKDLRLSLEPEIEDGPVGSGTIDEKGEFAVRNLPEGAYVFELIGRESELYLKEVRCAGEEYTFHPIVLLAGKVIGDCTLLLSRDVGEISGVVQNESKAADGVVVVLTPRDREQRRAARRTVVGQTDGTGHFRLRGILPGDYLAFAVPPMDDSGYFDLDFAERNKPSARLVSVKSRDAQVLDLKLTSPR